MQNESTNPTTGDPARDRPLIVDRPTFQAVYSGLKLSGGLAHTDPWRGER